MSGKFQYRTLFLSDIHLGKRSCQAEMLLDFMKEYDAETIYLIGDIFDGWRLRKGWYWPQSHNDVVQKLLRKARKGSKIIYIPGNHDEIMRNYLGTHFGGIEVVDRFEHEGPTGKKYLVIHGDQFDMVVMNMNWLAHIGDRAYEAAIWLSVGINRIRKLWGGQYWSLSKWAKYKVKKAVNFISDYEKVLASEARKIGVDGVICGHIHHPSIDNYEGIEYLNTGDWVESCTAITEDYDGQFTLVDWSEITKSRNKAHSKNQVKLLTNNKAKKKQLTDVA